MKGKIVGSRYKILEYLAEGGFGKTYLAEDTQLPGRDTCVVKQLYPSSEDPNFLAIARRLFKTEASTLHNLGHHNQIPKLLAYFEEKEKFYLVQQYIEGETLGKQLKSGIVWSESRVIALLRDGLTILQFVHQKGVIHRDVKPDNLIQRSSDGKIVLVDFGTVKEVLQGQQTNLGQLTVPVGTQGYMPTEQARGKPRPTSDLYALGIIAIQALTGIRPLELPEDDEGEIIWQADAKVSQGLAKILTKMTRYHFKDRYQSATETLQALTKISNPEEITKPQTVTSVQTLKNDQKARANLVARSVNQPVVLSSSNFSSQIEPTQQMDATLMTTSSVLHSVTPPSQPKKSPKLMIAIAGIALAIAGLGTYLIIPTFQNKPATTPETQTPDTTERVRQGDGFRDNL